jgi:multicomponent Na+:H+ antiporter subunit F
MIIVSPFESVFFPDAHHHVGFAGRALHVLLLAALLVLYRVMRGPTAADRIVAIDILGILVVGLCAILAIATGRSWYIDIGIAWALQSFISTLALAKHLEGRTLDD